MEHGKLYTRAMEKLVALAGRIENRVQSEAFCLRDVAASDRIFHSAADLIDCCAAEIMQGDEKRSMQLLDFAEYIADVGILIDRKLPQDTRLLHELLERDTDSGGSILGEKG